MAATSEENPCRDRPKQMVQIRADLSAFVRGDYALGFFRNVTIQVLAIIVLIEAIFLAEHFTPVFRDAVRHEAGMLDIMLVLIWSGTGIFDLALAIAVLVAVYATLVRIRENRELLVLFASGLGPYQLSALILLVAVAAQSVCVVGAGVIDPLSRYAQRSILFSTELQSLKKGVAQNEFYYFPSYVAYATDRVSSGNDLPSSTNTPPGAPIIIDARGTARPTNDRTLFVYQQIAPHASRVVTAAQARLEGPDVAGKIMLNLGDFTSHTFADAHPLGGPNMKPGPTPICINCSNDVSDIPRVTMRVRDMSQMMMVDQLLPFGPRGGADVEELTIFEQLVDKSPGPAARTTQMRSLAERLSRSLLSALAPLMALAALCLTSRRTNWFILPLACVGLMSVDLASEWVITAIAASSVAGALLPPILLFLAVAGLVLAVIVQRQNELVRPQLARS
jgi:lipopolysaccharide export system permease protein